MMPFSINRRSSRRSIHDEDSDATPPQPITQQYWGKQNPDLFTPSPKSHRHMNRASTGDLMSDSPSKQYPEVDARTELNRTRYREGLSPLSHLSSSQRPTSNNSTLHVITPEISSVKSRRSDSPSRSLIKSFRKPRSFEHEEGPSNDLNPGYEVPRLGSQNETEDSLQSQKRFSPIDPALVPVQFHRPTPDSPLRIQQTSTPNKETPENLRPLELEEHLANEKSIETDSSNTSTGGGFISSMFSAAHNAASHIISSKPHTDIKSHPKTEETEALTTPGSSTTFVQHLDTLFFGPGKKQSNSNLKNEIKMEEDKGNGAVADVDDDNEDHASIATVDSSATKSNVRGISFEPVRKTNLSTMGKGELRLEDLGPTVELSRVTSPVPNMVYNSSNNVPSVSQKNNQGSYFLNVPTNVILDEAFNGLNTHLRLAQPATPRGSLSPTPTPDNNNTTTEIIIPREHSGRRARSPQGRQDFLRPNSMPIQSLDILNGSKSFSGAYNQNQLPIITHSSSRSASRSRSLKRASSPAPFQEVNGKRARARSLGSSLAHPNSGSTGGNSSATTHGSKTLYYHSSNPGSNPRNSVDSRLYRKQHHNGEDDDEEAYDNTRNFSITSRSSSMTRFPQNNHGQFELKNVTYANAKRDSDFHHIFRGKLNQDEKLIDDFACALQKEILVQGRLYLSTFHISFKANILGWVTNVIIPLKEIVRLEKKNTAGVFPNALAIQTLHAKYTFSSFISRDSTFELITNVWNQLIRGSGAGDLGDAEFVRGVSGFNSDYSEDSDSDEEGVHEEMVTETEDSELNEDGEDDDDTVPSTDEEAETPTDIGDIIGPLKHSITSIVRDPQPNETKIIDKTIDAPLGKVYSVLFGDDTSQLKKIITKQGNRDISPIPAFTIDDSIRKRSYEYIKPLNSSVGPKQTLCQVSEAVDHYDFDSFVLVTQSTKSPDVPSGNSFVVITQFYLSWDEDNQTRIQIFTYITWSAKSWLKGPIESGTISGQKEALSVLSEELVRILNDGSKSTLVSEEDENEEEGVCSLPLLGPKIHEETSNEYKQKQGDILIAEEVFDIPLGTLYSVLFGDDTSYITQIIEAQKNKEISTITKFDKTENGGKRTYNYIKPLNAPVGPKQTKCLITESIEYFNLEKSIAVLQTTQTPDVPSGNAFTTNTTFYLSWAKDNGTKMFIVTYMNWTGKSWLKGPIEKGAIDGQKESIKILTEEIKSIISNNTTAGGKRRGKKGKKGKKGKAGDESYKSKDTKRSLSEEFLRDRPQYQIASMLALPYGGSFLLFFIVVIIMALTRGLNRVNTTTSNSSIGLNAAVNYVNIKGQDYILMPAVSDLTSSRPLANAAEFEIWEWINERSSDKYNKLHNEDGCYKGSSHSEKDSAEVIEEMKKSRGYDDQHLKEMIRVVEDQLHSLKREMAASAALLKQVKLENETTETDSTKLKAAVNDSAEVGV